MNFQLFKRLVAEDFDSSAQAMIGKIATIYNPLIDQLNSGFAKKLDFSNFNQEVSTFTTIVNTLGIPTSAIQLTSTLSTPCQGTQVINAVNVTDNTPLVGAVFISFTRSNGVISINQITGLPANKKYNITVILYG